MILNENTHQWLERMRTEVASIPEADLAVACVMQLGEVEFAHGLYDAARATLGRCLERFDLLHPGAWTSLVYSAARLCGRLSENRLLEPEVDRGVDWLAQPAIVEYQGDLRERVHEIAIQAGRADVVAKLVSDAWPGRPANALVDACRLAGWARDTAELRRVLPLARAAISEAGPGPKHFEKTMGYWLLRACVMTGLLTETAELGQVFAYPLEATDDLIAALWAASDRAAYASVRDGWLNHCVDVFRTETRNHHFCSRAVRDCAQTIRRLGDADGYRYAIEQFREAVAAWVPRSDWIACAVNCDLAVLYAMGGEAQISSDYTSAARRLFDGKVPGVPAERGGRSLMASILSAAYRDVGEFDLALRFARRISHADDRRLHLVSAQIVGGHASAAEIELAKLDSPEERASLIAFSLLAGLTVWSPRLCLP
jgi:hypothetical protein